MLKTYYNSPGSYQFVGHVFNPPGKPDSVYRNNRISDIKTADNFSTKGWKSKLGVANATTNRTVDVQNVTRAIECEYTQLCSAGAVKNQPAHYKGFPLGVNSALNWTTLLGTPTFSQAGTDALASARIYSKIHDASIGFSGGVFLGELRETIRMLRSPLLGLRLATGRYLDNVKKLQTNPKTKKRISSGAWAGDGLSSAYLEYTYGVAPLANDVEAIMDNIVRLQNSVTVTSCKTKADYETATIVNHFCGASTMGDHRIEGQGVLTERYTVYYSCGLLPSTDFALNSAQNWGLTLDEFVPTAWALLPWSFLVDYFFNVSEVLGAAFTVTDNVIYTSHSRVLESVYDYKFHVVPKPNLSVSYGLITKNKPGRLTVVRKNIRRDGILSPPTLVYDAPSYKQLLNMGALYVQLQNLTRSK